MQEVTVFNVTQVSLNSSVYHWLVSLCRYRGCCV